MAEFVSITLRSILRCPHCGFKVTESLSTARCVTVYTCAACSRDMVGASNRCVFCTHGSVACVSAQSSGRCCAETGGAIKKA